MFKGQLTIHYHRDFDGMVSGAVLASILSDPKSAKDRTVIQPHGSGEFSMINRSWRYIHHQSGEEELYDLKADPDEHHNLAGKEAGARTLASFRKRSPKTFAPQGMGIHAGNLRPRFEGESFQWRPWTRPPKKKRKTKKKEQ